MSLDHRATATFALEAAIDGEIGIVVDILRDLRDAIPVVPEHLCVLCRTDCDEVLRLRRLVRELEAEAQHVAYALVQERELRDTARGLIEERFPGEAAA